MNRIQLPADVPGEYWFGRYSRSLAEAYPDTHGFRPIERVTNGVRTPVYLCFAAKLRDCSGPCKRGTRLCPSPQACGIPETDAQRPHWFAKLCKRYIAALTRKLVRADQET